MDQVEFSVRETSPHRRYLDIDRRSGRLSTRVMIDREALCPYHPPDCMLTVEIMVGPRRFFDIIRVIIDVVDLNDNAPRSVMAINYLKSSLTKTDLV